MTPGHELEYTDVAELRGPLLVVRGVTGVGWDEFATIRLDAAPPRHGLVLEVDRDLVVVQVLEGTAGMEPSSARVAFAGSPLRIPVGPGWLGRVCNGRGEPLDGGPPVTGPATRAGRPASRSTRLHREPPAEPVLTGDLGDRRPDHAGRAARSCRSSRWRACRTWTWPPRSPRRRRRVASRSAWCSPPWA